MYIRSYTNVPYLYHCTRCHSSKGAATNAVTVEKTCWSSHAIFIKASGCFGQNKWLHVFPLKLEFNLQMFYYLVAFYMLELIREKYKTIVEKLMVKFRHVI